MLRKAAPEIDIRMHEADLARVEDQERLAQACADVDILVNNAGSNPAGDSTIPVTSSGAMPGISRCSDTSISAAGFCAR